MHRAGCSRFWSTGITLRFDRNDTAWVAKVEFETDRILTRSEQSVPTGGEIHTAPIYGDGAATRAALAVKSDAERMGIEFRNVGLDAPAIYLDESNWINELDESGPPEIEAILREAAEALHWWPGARQYIADSSPPRDSEPNCPPR